MQEALAKQLGFATQAAPTGGGGPTLGLAATLQHYRDALAAGEARCAGREEPKTAAFREEVLGKFRAWTAGLDASVRPNLLNCTPTDIVAFMEGWWLPRHGGEFFSESAGRCVPSSHYVERVLGCLSKAFTLAGRELYHTADRPTGNPVRSRLVTDWRVGYRRQLWREGYRSSGAVPMTADKLRSLIAALGADVTASPDGSLVRARLLRDLCGILYLWHGAQRGAECGALKTSDLWRIGASGLEHAWGWVTTGPHSEGEAVLIEPSGGTKKAKHEHPGTIEIRVLPPEEGEICFVRWLRTYSEAMASCGYPLMTDGWLFRPCTRGGGGFQHAPTQSSAMNKAMQDHLSGHGLWEGETLHGIRRGSMQHSYYELMMSTEEIAEACLVRNPQSLERYLDRVRHGPRLLRLAQERAAQGGSEAQGGGKDRPAKKRRRRVSRGQGATRGTSHEEQA